MNEIVVHDKRFVTFITADEINRCVCDIATTINLKYQSKKVIFVVVLDGAFMFASDLLKEIQLECEVAFIKVKSYQGTLSTGNVKELIGLNKNLKNEHVVILEDIVDTGITMDKVVEMIQSHDPKTIEVCTLLYKKEAHRGEVKPNYVAFEIENKFVIGYGLDYNEEGRNLKAIFQLSE
ncbi:MAG: hypoxanthine phosphoribosyltransferase [Crocinitomicaceae bacterium]|nr:hypoxanthine phosphoribosyltransferase [Crocinitomicaceae bacterium]